MKQIPKEAIGKGLRIQYREGGCDIVTRVMSIDGNMIKDKNGNLLFINLEAVGSYKVPKSPNYIFTPKKEIDDFSDLDMINGSK